MRRAARVDENQSDIVKALRKAGYSVAITSGLGEGFPDLLVGARGKNYLLEIKDGSKPPSAQKLTADQVKWHRIWSGHVAVIDSVESALKEIGI